MIFSSAISTLCLILDYKELESRFQRYEEFMRSRRRLPDGDLQRLIDRLLDHHRPNTDIPVIISTMEGEYRSSVGRLLERGGARASVLVDTPLQLERAVTVFLPENAYVGEVVGCTPSDGQFTVDLLLIQERVKNAP